MISVVSKALGLVRQYNPLSVAPGALGLAENCVIRRENVIEPRRGYTAFQSSFQGGYGIAFFENRVLVHRGSSGRINYWDGAVSQDLDGPEFFRFTGLQPRFIDAYQNLYTTTSSGVKAISVLSLGSRRVGAPRGIDFDYTLTSGASGFLVNGDQCAYRHLIKRIDANDNVIFGYPSQRLWVINGTAGAENVVLTITLSNEVVEGDVLQVYRTNSTTGTATDTSGDECGLIYEYTIQAADVTAGSISFTDSVTDTLIGANLYTNPSEEGISQGNNQPPIAKDIALYKSNFMFYANTETKHRLNFSLVGTSGLTGNTLTIAGTAYNFGATEIISGAGSPQVKVGATGVAAVDIDTTARSLVKVINQFAANTSVYAYYLSGPDSLPGQILLEEQTIGGSEFTVLGSNVTIGGMVFPEAPVGSSTDAMTSTSDIRPNALYYSKNQQPEAVPLLNYLPVGPTNAAILRIAPLRDSMIIISEVGIFRLTGEDPQSFTIVTLDDTVRVKAAESVQVLSNQVYALSNQGIIRISENGVEVISREIEIDITKLLQFTNYQDYTFSGSYESERLYMLSTISADGLTEPDVTYVYNIFTRTWTKWTFGFFSARVWDKEDKMYISRTDASSLSVERKSFTDDDFADEEINFSIATYDSATQITGSSGTAPQIGWHIEKEGLSRHITGVVDNGGSSYTLTFESIPSAWEAGVGATLLYPSVGMEFEWLHWNGGQPAALKQIRSVAILSDDTSGENSVSQLDISFRSNFEGTKEYQEIDTQTGYGSYWGGPWGGGSYDDYAYPTLVPAEKQYSNRLFVGVRHRRAREKLSVAGIGYEFEMVSEEVGI